MPAVFIFDTEDGTIAGWESRQRHGRRRSPTTTPTKGRSYKGLAIGTDGGANRIYATNFHEGDGGRPYDGDFEDVERSGAFTDPDSIPAGYAPFGIQNLGGSIYVTYAKQDEDKEDDVAGSGNGFVDAFDGAGNLREALRLARPAERAVGCHAGAGVRSARSPARSSSATSATAASTRSTPVPARSRASFKTAGGSAIEIEGLWGLAVRQRRERRQRRYALLCRRAGRREQRPLRHDHRQRQRVITNHADRTDRVIRVIRGSGNDGRRAAPPCRWRSSPGGDSDVQLGEPVERPAVDQRHAVARSTLRVLIWKRMPS